MDLIIFIICSILVIFIYTSNFSKVFYLKKLSLPLLLIFFIILLILFSDTAVESARSGLNLWLNIVFPSLFPFFVVSDILGSTGFVRAIGILLEPVMRPLFNVPGCGSFALAMGITSGYPVGARITASLKAENLIKKSEAERLLAFTNNSGPLFIAGAVATGMLQRPDLGVFLLASHILASITVGILFGLCRKPDNSKNNVSAWNALKRFKSELAKAGKTSLSSLGSVLRNAINNSIMTILAIGGFIILFSVIINMLLKTGFIGAASNLAALVFSPFGANSDVFPGIVSGFFEITTGASIACKTEALPLEAQLTAVSLIIGWGGLSVHFQVLSIVSSSGISIKPYLLGKLLHGIISAIYTYIGIKTTGLLHMSKPAFSQLVPAQGPEWKIIFIQSIQCLIVTAFILAICTFISILIMVISPRRN
ncbi:MAG: sporulation integral membrane protein YlbJ [Clostridia bacterium]|nr:sporulation integral membrane protein YlbJ [Clostridia bacterium]